jgi:hypothetical protein
MAIPLAEQRRRRAARIALYVSLAQRHDRLGLGAHHRRPPRHKGEQWLKRDYLHLPEVLLLRPARIDTTEKSGSELAGARFLASRFEAAGIRTRVEVLGGKKANLFAWIDGKDPHPLVLHNHIDVSNVDPSEWFYPPFAAHVDLPWVYGRGVFDMKSVAIAQMLAMIDLKKSGVPLNRTVLFLGTSSEERGSRLGVRRLVQQQPDLVRSFWAVLTEGGVVEARSRDDIKLGTEVLEARRPHRLRRRPPAAGPAGGSQRGPTQPTCLGPGSSGCSDLLADPRPGGPARLLHHPDKVLDDVATPLARYLQSMFRSEAFPFPVQEAPGGVSAGHQVPAAAGAGPRLGAGGAGPLLDADRDVVELDEPQTASGGSNRPPGSKRSRPSWRKLPRGPRRPSSSPGRGPTPFFRVLGVPPTVSPSSS